MKKLFDKTTFGKLELKNRFWRSATWLNMADEKGHVTERLINEYEKLAAGGVGTIITGYAFVLEEEQPNPGMLGIYDDSFIEEYKQLNEKLHKYGTKTVMQIVYGGSFTNFNTEERLIWGPSAVPHPIMRTTPTEMTKENIQTVINAFANAALRVKKSNFDAVQFHGAHSYLLSQFLSPYYNKRTDEYGGSLENRCRIIVETLDAVRKKVGDDYPVLIKMHATDDWDENGIDENDALYVAKKLEEHGIDGIEFSGGNLDMKNYINKGPGHVKINKVEDQSYFAEKTALIAKELNIPVISVGGHRTPSKMEEILNSSNIEYFALCRTLFADPDQVNKWENNYDAKVKCVSCGKCFSKNGNVCILNRKK